MTHALRTLREKLFATPLDTVITLVVAFLLWRAVVPLFEWFFADATFAGTSRADCTGAGACWVFVRARFGQFMYGLYPSAERWRVDLAGIILVSGIVPVWKLPGPAPSRSRPSRAAAAGRLAARGGFGLPVETRDGAG
jgi:general L-amino acid transport system permease protein